MEDACIGALPNANKAFQDADEVKAKLQELNNKITQAAAQVSPILLYLIYTYYM